MICTYNKPPPRVLIIEKDLMRKPYLGGWRHKNTGIVYLNGDSQTGPPPKRLPQERLCSRKVQTSEQSDKECQPPYESATQMWRKDCFIACVSDKYITPKPYRTAEEVLRRPDFDRELRLIQRWYRGLRMLRFVKECARIYRKLRDECDMLEEEERREERKRREGDCTALAAPRTLTEVDALLCHVEEEQRGHQPRADESPRRRRLRLLEERQRAFLVAERSALGAREARKRERSSRFLRAHCKPHGWLGSDGRLLEMHSLRYQAATECWNLLDALTHTAASDPGTRMETLLKARNSIENHECKDANAFRGLLDQEIVLISKEVGFDKFEFLRKRIVGAFLQFLRTSHNCTCVSEDGSVSPSMADYEFREPLDKSRIFCTSCRKLLPCNRFPLIVRKLPHNKCKGCFRLQALARGHVDLRPYIALLRQLQLTEGGLADAMEPSDVRHLVLDVWHGRSVLSGRTEPAELRLPRYELDQPWSPWNCLLLTHQEAKTHVYLGGGGTAYSAFLRRRIATNHRTAKLDFKGLVAFERSSDLRRCNDSQPEAAATKDCGCDDRSQSLTECLSSPRIIEQRVDM